ncbi:alpha/beta fold hydrolase [Marinitenerispora sediminis]|uniref:Alpha/beta hydrolase n=1 Tax=Marinitenerispora sediminis TaxID=1931232 RepID=A0A368TD09_9ACTN|nr:alpha/beta hydrolase [Marinitenerispora sediminis]RCV56850.1 alpha/beta hydrolase [Marinitenerispora sediminis]RCV59025.1 alpha/beta hydrolase [Marinitenerispora sediminis]RCV61559.1 alpha/beta hydrolase [Marinitenerispora sediminis]
MSETSHPADAGAPVLWHEPAGAAAAEGPGRDRPPVLLLHGFGSTAELNWGRTGWLRALHLAGARTIAPDLPGHGRSPRPHAADRYTPARLVEEVLRLLDALGEPRVDVLGYSMGARLAWELAAGHPDRVRRAVLAGFGPADVLGGPGSGPARQAGPTAPADDPFEGPFAEVFRTAAALPHNDPAALAACARGQAAHPFTADPVPEGVPLLFAAGERDSLAAGVETLAARVPGARVVRAPGRDHRTAVTSRELRSAVLEFLAPPGDVTHGDRTRAARPAGR